MTTQTKESLAALCLAAFTFGLYFFALNAPFYLDDQHMIVENVFIKNSQYYAWLWKGYVTSSTIPRGMCRPVLMFTFIFNYLSAGLTASGYRIVNILLHFLNGMLLYSLLKLIRPTASKLFLFFITAVFIAHPINTEAVIYISSRSDLLTALFLLSAIILWIKEKPLFAISLYAMALLTKETALCFPMLAFAWDWAQMRSIKKVFDKKKSIMYAALAAVTVAYFLYCSAFFSHTPVTPPRSVLSNTLVQTAVTFLYAKLFLLLEPFNMMHDIPSFSNFFTPPVIMGFALIILLIGYTLKRIKKEPVIAFGIIWFLVCLLPKFYARLGFPAMEHHAYIPLFGIYIALTVILEKFYTRQKRYFLLSSAGIIATLTIFTIIRSIEYTDPLMFWRLAAARAPQTGVVHNYLGLEYLRSKLPDKAKAEFLKAVKIADRRETIVTSKINLAIILNDEGLHTEALKLLREASTVTPIVPVGVNEMLGVVYMSMGDKEKAIKAWAEEINSYPDSYEAVLNMGVYYFGINDLPRAERLFDRSIFLKPEAYLGYYGLAQTMEKEGNLKRAAKLYHDALILNPRDAAAAYFLGSVLGRLGNDKAIYYLQTAIDLNPRSCEAHNDLAVAYASLKSPRWDMAQNEIKAAQENNCKVNTDLTVLIEKNAHKK
jgi:tetratricopeptide (TPR) repeat protein